MNHFTDQLKNCRHLVVVDESAESGKTLSNLRPDRDNSVTWTNRGTTALRLVPSHYDSTWLVGADLVDMQGKQLLALLHEIEPALNARLIADWSSIAHAVTPATRKDSGWIDDW